MARAANASGKAQELADEISRRLAQIPHATVALRKLRREASRALRDETPATVVAVVEALLEQRSWARRAVAYELLLDRPEALAGMKERQVLALAKGASGWGEIDLVGVSLTGPAWRVAVLSDGVLRKWTESEDLWTRRLAVVSTIALNSRARGGTGDTGRTLDICRRVISDREPMVVKALSWALRELSKRDPSAALLFISEHAATLDPLVLREVSRKIQTGRKSG